MDSRAPKLAGHAIKTGVRSQNLGGFVEIVAPEAVTCAAAASGRYPGCAYSLSPHVSGGGFLYAEIVWKGGGDGGS
jgi:hypothetical protein